MSPLRVLALSVPLALAAAALAEDKVTFRQESCTYPPGQYGLTVQNAKCKAGPLKGQYCITQITCARKIRITESAGKKVEELVAENQTDPAVCGAEQKGERWACPEDATVCANDTRVDLLRYAKAYHAAAPSLPGATTTATDGAE